MFILTTVWQSCHLESFLFLFQKLLRFLKSTGPDKFPRDFTRPGASEIVQHKTTRVSLANGFGETTNKFGQKSLTICALCRNSPSVGSLVN